MAESKEAPWLPEKGETPSKFQRLQERVDFLAKAGADFNIQEREIKRRDAWIQGKCRPEDLAFLKGTADYLAERIASSEDQLKEANRVVEELPLLIENVEKELAGPDSSWKENFAGLPTYYLNTSVDRLRGRLGEETPTSLTSPSNWEWYVPPEVEPKLKPPSLETTKAEEPVFEEKREEEFQPSWALEKKDEFRDPYVRRLAGRLHDEAPSEVANFDYLSERRKSLEDKVLNGEVSEEEGGILLARLGRRLDALRQKRTSIGPSAEGEEAARPRERLARAETLSEQQKEIIRELDGISQEAGEEKDFGSGSLETENIQSIGRRKEKVRGGMARLMELGGVSSERGIADLREIGPDELRSEFRARLHALIEEQGDQSFDANWRLIYPLEQTIQSLMPTAEERGEGVIYRYKDAEGLKTGKLTVEELNKLRQELNAELNAFRNIHNFIYVYRRAAGFTPVLEASAFLPRQTIQALLNRPEVAKRLAEFEKIGKRYQSLMEESRKKGEEAGRAKGDARVEAKKISMTLEKEAEAIKKRATLLMIERPNQPEEGPFWANRIAGGLYSGLHESARHDMQINESGDFFTNRIFQMSDRARTQWRNLGRAPNPKLMKDLDLRVTGFWEDVLEGELRRIKKDVSIEAYSNPASSRKKKGKLAEEIDQETKKRFEEFCKRQGISASAERDEEGQLSIESFDMVAGGVDFSKIKLSREAAETAGMTTEYFDMPSDRVRLTNLSVDDADRIRKAISDPKGFLDDPSLQTLKKMYEQFKHLKGAKRSRWYKPVIEDVIYLFRDTVAPGIESTPHYLRRCPAKEIYPNMVPWTDRDVEGAINLMAPPLTKPDLEEVLNKVIGSKARRQIAQGAEAVGKGVATAIWEMIKAAFFGSK